MKCEDVTKLASDGLDRRLSLRETLGLRFHLLGCDNCSRFSRQVRTISGIARRYKSTDTAEPRED